MLGALRYLVELEWPIRGLRPLIGRYNPFDAGFAQDPYPQYDALRREHPVYWSRPLQSFVLTRHADVVTSITDPRFSTDRNENALLRLLSRFAPLHPRLREALRVNIQSASPADHARQREATRGFFTGPAVQRLRPRIAELVEELLGEAERRGRLELIGDLAYPLPVRVICEILGLPAADRDRLKTWSDAFAVLLDPLAPGASLAGLQKAFLELCDYFRERFADKRERPGDDLLTHLVTEADAGGLSETELLALCAFVLSAGHETVTDAIGNAVVCLIRDPGERKRLQDDPGLMRTAVEEFLRFESPLQSLSRVAVESCELAGVRIDAGRMVTAVVGSANRDPERFPEPARLDLERRDNPHLAFGAGAHFCLGAALARVELHAALSGLFERFPDWSGDPGSVRWKPSMGLRGVQSLALSL
ncbi:MAG: cytochrome P450 [Myxococcota bacterium]|nr:cytochrome P450 [Myxococcota bacterium]